MGNITVIYLGHFNMKKWKLNRKQDNLEPCKLPSFYIGHFTMENWKIKKKGNLEHSNFTVILPSSN